MAALGKLADKIRPLDAFSKTLDEIRIQTFSGGIVTILCTVLMLLLFLSELNHYQTLKVTETLFVDVSRSGKLRINLDVTFYKISCGFLNVDVMDSSGERLSSIEKTITKHKTDMLGNLAQEEPTEVVRVGHTTVGLNGTCGSCYGAENAQRKCCNSCEDIISAYMEMGWALRSTEDFEQCKREFKEKHISINKEGCRLTGYVEVNKIQGNLHIAPGSTFGGSGMHSHVHNLIPFEAKDVNTTHLVHHYSYGVPYPGRIDPMDNMMAVAGEGAMMFSYYTKIVPTMYASVHNFTTRTFQYSLTTHKKSLARSGTLEKGLPGLFVYYELSPIMVKMEEEYRSTMHFLTSVCAIVGGLFTVAGIVDGMIYRGGKVIRKFHQG
ncbi:endoplasmic reticulum-Golgi intermediate compartment protein 3-like [Paramacrobiotus metropolitanus]|uniref:endoplasmic reticulum-Golgi intermediate compartment protein 3-like n=1 Tax=Paramacrobiotus metropolitanus TaxID=2943436 RepID=UPI0024460427|nr:endoplasmic reticulum-Golgi intermediate compartment protein 3-like [Paramacrobiotus metropolitanus]